MTTEIMRTVFATEQPLLIGEVRDLLYRAGLPSDPQVVGPEVLEWAVTQPGRCLAIIDGELLPAAGSLVRLRQRAPQARLVLWVGSVTPELIQIAIECRADGVLSADLSADDAAQALARISRGERQFRFESVVPQEAPAPSIPDMDFTMRERQVLRLVADGRNNANIAAELHTTERRVRNCLHGMFHKTGVGNRHQLALLTRVAAQAGPAVRAAGQESFDAYWMLAGVTDN
jgi:DNA-binding NarL/FixJ family response regulator